MVEERKRTSQVARLLDCSKDTVRDYRISLQIGTEVPFGAGTTWVFTAAEIERIREVFKGICGRQKGERTLRPAQNRKRLKQRKKA